MQKNTTEAKSVRFPDFTRYRFYGYTFDVPVDYQVQGVEIANKEYSVVTDKKILTLKACLKCKRLLDYERFYDRRSPCKECHILMVKRWKKKHPEMVKKHKQVGNKNYRIKQKRIAAGFL